MQLIDEAGVQQILDRLKGQDLYIHLEMTNGAYASHMDKSRHTASTFIKNAQVRYSEGSIAGKGPYRVGLKLEQGGWVYSEGLTHWEDSETERLVMAGHDKEGRLVVALQLSREPF
ncbi:YojF family protein [Paenibacillus sp. FJAT-26967]|uniref:YojF family protein n=1 Tax=Paenibacillus sp. FJAT-26967 TaxID=1729690 RepID=UPI0008399526|nr:YojF family protein [Paenibacillus sp. FJAT-26967]